jgi:hypothetical protein
MYTIIKNTGKLVALKFSGDLEKKDYEQFLPILEEKIRQQGKINLYWEMADFDGWDAAAAWKDFQFDIKHANDFNNVAMVGETGWQDFMTQLMKPFTGAEVQYFDRTQREEALAWAEA